MSGDKPDDGLHLASFPVGVSVDLFTATGGILEAALRDCGRLMLAADDGWNSGGNAAKLVLRTELHQAQVAAALRAAAEQIDPGQTANAANEAEPGDDGLSVGHMRAEDEGVSFGMGGDLAEQSARDLAARLATAMLPAMEKLGAGNYLAWDFIDPQQGGRWELTITKPRGLTPHQARNRLQDTLRWIVGATRDRRRTKGEIIGAAQRALDEVKAPTDEATS